MIAKLRERLRIGRVVVVADRAVMAQKTIKAFTEHKGAPFDYVLGCRMRQQTEVTEEVLARAGRYREVAPNLKAKEVVVSDRRYVVCLNPEEAAKDERDRQAILSELEETLVTKGPTAVIGNEGFARFLKVLKGDVTINQQAVEADRRLDGKFVLTTNATLSPAEVARSYKGLWRVERTFRKEKPTLEVRAISHQGDETSIGRFVASLLALRLEVDLQARLDEKKVETSWPDLMRDLKERQAVRMTLDGTPCLIRTDFQGVAYQALKVAGVRPPSRVMRLDGAPRSVVP